MSKAVSISEEDILDVFPSTENRGFELSSASGGSKYLSVSFVSAPEIRKLNKKYRGVDEVTDVLSFEMGEEREEGFYIGDVVVCEEQARRQATERGVSFEQEVADLVAHGVLHLLGVHHD